MSVTTTASSLAKAVLLKVSAAAHRSRHLEPVSCSSCCAVWCLRLPADLQAASPVPQARPSSQCRPADGACTCVVTPLILTHVGRLWSLCVLDGFCVAASACTHAAVLAAECCAGGRCCVRTQALVRPPQLTHRSCVSLCRFWDSCAASETHGRMPIAKYGHIAAHTL